MKLISVRIFGATCAAVLLAVFSSPPYAASQSGVYAYPLAGQSAQQQGRDKFECHNWAVNETGVDPHAAPLASEHRNSASSKGFLGIGGGRNALGGQGNILSDAATGAGLGALGGAIAGDAGEGALIGAGASALLGGILRSQNASETHRDPHSTELQRQRRLDDYRRAYGTCMSARNYRVS